MLKNKCAMDFDPIADQDTPIHSFFISSTSHAKITSWNVAVDDKVRRGVVLLSYALHDGDGVQSNCNKDGQLKSTIVGVVRETLFKVGEMVPPGSHVVSVEMRCEHSVVVYDLCTDCGLNLRKGKSGPPVRPGGPTSDRISMVHGIPEIQISREEAELLGNKDKLRLLSSRKLALIIDLDQTLIHTSVDPNVEPGLPDVYGFRLPGHSMLYHCRLRPHARQFLLTVSKYYETHVFTMGTKLYAASVTHILDPDKKLFHGRIISRDDCFDPHSKALRLKSVFPCGDAMVAIIDDREDVWRNCPNLIHVKPYVFFAGTSDINAPPGSHPSRPHTKNTPSIASHVTHPHTSTNTNLPNTDSNSINPSKNASPIQLSTTKHIPVQKVEGPFQSTIDPAVQSEKVDSSSSSNSDSDRDDTSSSSSSSVDDTVFDALENSPTEPSNNELISAEALQLPTTAEPLITTPTFDLIKDKKADVQITTPTFDLIKDKKADVQITTPTFELIKDKKTDVKVTAGTIEIDPKMDLSESDAMDTEADSQAVLIPTETPPIKGKARNIEDPDHFLLDLTETLKRVHKMFYSEFKATSQQSHNLATPDLKQIIPEIRRSVLKGTKILFTGVIPTNLPVEKSPEWNTARAFGASIHDRFVYGLTSSNPRKAIQATTHVIVGRPGTSKLREARRISGIKIVSPKWLWSCAEQWKLVDERGFPIQLEDQEQIHIKPLIKSPKITTPGHRTDLKDSTHTRCEDDVFDQDLALAEKTSQKSRIPERQLSIGSVSDEELERMNAEVDAEIDVSSGSSSNEGDVSRLVEAMDEDVSLSYDKSAGSSLIGENGRKRKHDDVSSSSDNSPHSLGLLDESVDVSESSDGDSGDELAKLLGT